MFKRILYSLILLGFLTIPSFAVDTDYNVGTITYQHSAGKWHYHEVITIDSIASGDIVYTPAIYIPGTAQTYDLFRVVASEVGTEDFNVFPVYMDDGSASVASYGVIETTDSDLDAVGTTAILDSLGIVQGTITGKNKVYSWLVFKIVNGQAITAACTITIDIGGDLALGVDPGDVPGYVETND